jgi:hypothetical protein
MNWYLLIALPPLLAILAVGVVCLLTHNVPENFS